ncbi:hypothetical protein E2C01_050530 [Portunus trituberculatus]|uniref:Uncharacterized protein n=1 Tax=Portunus trituberculatus TaxID=210409 RepID=A0A5B7GHS6_PORTR|nr:hypothetical protein [Portunus trituberculatus]
MILKGWLSDKVRRRHHQHHHHQHYHHRITITILALLFHGKTTISFTTTSSVTDTCDIKTTNFTALKKPPLTILHININIISTRILDL